MTDAALSIKLENLFTGLNITQKSVRDIHKVYDSALAFRFNSLNFFKPGENKISQILAYFLDPKSSHGQGKIFLDLFLSEFCKKELRYDDVKVVTEHRITNSIDSRRIDILMIFDRVEFAIAIENKIWAKDQLLQITDYNKYLAGKYGTNYVLFYLNPYKSSPSDDSIAKDILNNLVNEGQLVIIDYSTNIIKLLNNWINHCRAERVKHFLIDFEQFLQQEINGEKFMNEHKIVADYILKSGERIETAFLVEGAADEIRRSLAIKFIDQLQQLAVKLLLQLILKGPLEKQYGGFSFTNEMLKDLNLLIQFEFQEKGYRDLIFGLVRPVKSTEQLPNELQQKLTSAFFESGKVYSSSAWIWYVKFENNRNWNNQTFLDIDKGVLIEIIKEKVQTFINVMESFVLATTSLNLKQ